MWRKWTTRVSFLCATVIVLRCALFCNVNQTSVTITSSVIDDKAYNPGDFVNLGFSRFEFEQVKLQEIQLEHDYNITAILLHWKQLDALKNTLKQLMNTTLVKEIIIWNNNPQINLTVRHLINHSDASTKSIRIINSKENLKDAAKYRACTEAKTSACFYVSNDWRGNFPIKSLVASFRSDPSVLHSVTDSSTYLANLVCSYFVSTIDLHTGCLWTDVGSIFLRKHAQQHLRLLEKLVVNYPALVHSSDVFFSIWLNDLPSHMNTDIHLQHLSSESRFAALKFNSSMLAFNILEHFLRLNQSNNDDIEFSRQSNRRFPYYVKSPSPKDDLIFYSNVLPVEIQNITFNITRNFVRDQDTIHFLSHSTPNAVDRQLSTCWHTTRDLHVGDFFAIDFLRAQTNITFTLTVSHSPMLQENLDMRISFDGIWWISYRSLKGRFALTNRNSEEEEDVYTTLFDASQFAPGFQSFRYVAFQLSRSYNQRFQVCDIQIISKKNLPHIMRNFQALN